MVPADVTNVDQVTEAYATIDKAWGAVDVLVNNAGRNSGKRHLRQLTVAEMTSILDVNLKAAFLCSMAVLPAMRVRKAGTLIHVGSMAATMVFPTAGASYRRRIGHSEMEPWVLAHGLKALRERLKLVLDTHPLAVVPACPKVPAVPAETAEPRERMLEEWREGV